MKFHKRFYQKDEYIQITLCIPDIFGDGLITIDRDGIFIGGEFFIISIKDVVDFLQAVQLAEKAFLLIRKGDDSSIKGFYESLPMEE